MTDSDSVGMTQAQDDPLDHPSAVAAAWYGLAVLIGATVFSLVNLQMIYVLAEAFKRDLSLSDTQVGALNGLAIGATTALATFPMGWLSDRMNRKILLAGCVLIWSAATAAAGLSSSYMELFLAIMGIAIGEAVLGPITYSIIPDLFSEKRRVTANFIFFGASIIGASLGLLLSGAAIGFIDGQRAGWDFIDPAVQTWRIALIASALPGPIMAAFILFMRLGRARSHNAAQSGQGRHSILAYFRRNSRSLFSVFAGFGLSYSAKSTMFVWAPPALIRVFEENAATVGVRLGAITAISSVLGVVCAGLAYRSLRDRLGYLTAPRVAQVSLTVGGLCLLAFWAATSVWQVYGVLFLFSAAATAAMSLSPTMLQDISPPHVRGRVVALGGMCAVLFGSLTPLMVGFVSDVLAPNPAAIILAMVIVGVPALLISVAIIRFGEARLEETIADAQSAL